MTENQTRSIENIRWEWGGGGNSVIHLFSATTTHTRRLKGFLMESFRFIYTQYLHTHVLERERCVASQSMKRSVGNAHVSLSHVQRETKRRRKDSFKRGDILGKL